MKVLFNFSTLKKGGGQNVGINFIMALMTIYKNRKDYYFLVPYNSSVYSIIRESGSKNIILCSRKPIIRILQELLFLPSIIKKNKIDIIYTYFGFALLSKKFLQVCGNAVSNIFFPEINFWSEYKGWKLFKRRIIDKYRIWGMKRADGIIFENEMMMARASKIYGIDPQKTIFIKPSINELKKVRRIKNISEIEKKRNLKIKILVLCGWQRHKNVFKIPEIASELKNLFENFEILFTVPKDNSKDYLYFKKMISYYKVDDFVRTIGVIEKNMLPKLFEEIDIVLLMSKLESFSNNIIEAWMYGKPLVITDAEWSRTICKDSAAYINRDSPKDIAKVIFKISKSSERSFNYILEGYKELGTYPSTKEKINAELLFIKRIYENKKNMERYSSIKL